ncbi:MAG: bacteriohemerythrin [Candidatus Thiodiazotropha sp.]
MIKNPTGIDIFPWNDNFDTGLEEVDRQHRKLVQILNRLASQVAFGVDDFQLSGVFDELIDYTHYHFDTEEAIWNHYLPDSDDEAAHKKSHAHFVETLRGLQDDEQVRHNGKKTEDVLDFLVRWLATHILESDREMALVVQYLRQGSDLAQARIQARHSMSGSTRAMIDIILSIYATLSRNTLQLMRELIQRKRMDVQLQQSEAGYRSLFDSMLEAVYVIDREQRMLSANAGAVRLFGYPAEWFKGQLVADIMQPKHDRQGSIDEACQRAFNGESQSFESAALRSDGSSFPCEVHLTRGVWFGRSVVIMVARDITERKIAQQAVLEASQRYAAVLDSSNDGFWLIDTRGRLVEVNDVYCRLSGYSREEVIGMTIPDLDVIETPDSVAQRLSEIRLSGNEIFESQHQRKDASVWPVEVSISYSPVQGGRFFTFLRDIRDRKVEEQLGRLRHALAELVYSDNQQQLLQTALDLAEEMTQSRIGYFHFVDMEHGREAEPHWSAETYSQVSSTGGASLQYALSQAGSWVECINQRQPLVRNDCQALLQEKDFADGHASLHREMTVPVLRDGHIVAVLGVGNKSYDYDDQDIYVASRVADITYDYVERNQAERQIQFMAYNDLLTGLPNRQLFADRLQQAISHIHRSDKLLAICYLDLDGFKPINDRFGHQTGDRLLISLAARLKKHLREGDTVARVGGDEFVILLNDLGNIHQGEEIIQRILESVTEPFVVDRHRIYVSASIGGTLYPLDDADPDTLLRHADQAMYGAKQDGRNTYRLYDPIKDQKVHAHHRFVEEFEQGLERSELLLHFQPRIDLCTGEMVSVEALVRWQHPDKGLLMPGDFLPMIADRPLEIALDEWVIKAALDQHMRWRVQGLHLPVSVNLSTLHIQQTNFPEFLKAVLQNYPQDIARYLELEVLETRAIADTYRVAEIMNACAELGVHFSLDDFGTGYSSLTYFHRLPISIVKVDQHFVQDMLNDPLDQDIVEGVIRMAEALKRPVVAEGVESIEVGLMLSQLGCQFAQGYGIAEPMPADRLLDWMTLWKSDRHWRNLKTVVGPTGYYDLNVAIFTHRRWMDQVLACLKSGSLTELPDMAFETCQLSHWYEGIGATRFGTRPGYAFIQSKHRAIHQLAMELALQAENPQAVGEVMLRLSDLEAASNEFLEMLIGLSE